MVDDVGADRTSLSAEVVSAVRAIVATLQREAPPAWIDLDLTISQLKALFVLAKAGPMPIGRLGEALHLRRPAASILVDALVRAGLAERVEDALDRRRTLTGLTAAAQERVGQIHDAQHQRFVSWLERLDTDDLAGLARGLRRLADVATEGAPERCLGETSTRRPSD